MCFAEESKFGVLMKGTIFVTSKFTKPFYLVVILGRRNQEFDNDFTQYENYIALRVREKGADFLVKVEEEQFTVDSDIMVKRLRLTGIDKEVQQTYWFSYDRDDMTIKYGKGHAMEETILIQFNFKNEVDPDQKEKYKRFFELDDLNPETDGNFLLYRTVEDDEKKVSFNQGAINKEQLLRVRKEPLIKNKSPVILEADTLEHLKDKSELPCECTSIYGEIKPLSPLEPELIDAIRSSITTAGDCLNTILKGKPYLRITVGEPMGTSPGSPYVLEIWPAGAESPIHNHGGCCAVIKVLHGTIQCRIFNKITNPPQETSTPLQVIDLRKDQYTWMDDGWFQTHQLSNVSDDYCATLQCYKYKEEDNLHWPKFDYKSEDVLAGFNPGSDLTFEDMKKKVLKEVILVMEGKYGSNFPSI